MAPEPRIAIIGAGIVGVTFAHALLERSLPVQIYEQSPDLRITGGGINAHEAGVRALKRCGKDCYDAFAEVGVPHNPEQPEIFYGLTQGDKVFNIISKQEHGSMPRLNFLTALVKRLPEGTIKYGKRVKDAITETSGDIRLEFADGTKELVDVVVGCDGVNSSIRRYVVGTGYDATFSHNVICRGFVPAQEVENIVGKEQSKGSYLGFGHGEGSLYYRVDKDTMSLVYYFQDPEPWPYFPSVVHVMSKEELFRKIDSMDVSPKHRALAGLFPDQVNAWAIMHLYTPLPTYCNGRIAVMGDAAHGSSPYLSSGAGQGYEDAAVCAELFAAVGDRQRQSNSPDLHAELERALQVYSQTRMPRSQHVVQSSFEAGKLLMGSLPFEQAAKEYTDRQLWIFKGDIGQMVDEALRKFEDA